MALQDIGVRAVVEGLANFKTSIDEMTAKTKSYTDQTVSGLKAAQFQVDAFAKSIDTTSTKMGITLAASGAAITAALGLSVKSAADEEAVMLRLSVALKNVGVDFDSVIPFLDKFIMSTEQSTKVNHDELYESFIQLTSITQNYQKAVELLPLALDLARGKNLDLSTAAMLVGKVAQGNTSLLSRYGIIIDENATATQALGELQKVYGGQAVKYGESTKGAMEGIKNSTESLSESIGQKLLPIVYSLSKIISDSINMATKWTAVNPLLTQVLVISAAATGLLLTATGGLILALPTLITLQASATAVMNGTAFATGATTVKLLAQAAAHTILAVATRGAAAAMWVFDAAMAGNPVGLAIVGIAALAATFGAYKLATIGAKDSTDNLNKSIDDYQPPIDTAIAKTEAWKNALIELGRIQNATSDIESQSAAITKKLTEETAKQTQAVMNQVNSKKSGFDYDGTSTSLAKLTDANGNYVDSLQVIPNAADGATNANKLFAQSLLSKDILTDWEKNWLKTYKNVIDGTISTNKVLQAQQQAIIDEQTKLTDALKGFGDTATKIGDAWNYANTKAGKLGLTMDDMTRYLLAQGHSVEELKTKYLDYGADIQKWADGMGVSLDDVALASKSTSGSMVLDAEKFTSEAKKLTEEYVKDQKSALDDILSAEKSAYQERIDNIDKVLQAQLDAYDEELAGLNDQLSEIDNLQKESDDSQKKADLETQISTEYDLKKTADLNKELDDLIVNSGNETWQKQRKTQLKDLIANEDDVDVKKNLQAEYDQYLVDLDLETQKTTLENQIKGVEDKKKIAQDKADFEKSLEDQKMADFTTNIASQKAALDVQLTEAKARYDSELVLFKAKNTTLIDETVAFVKQMNEELAKVKPVAISTTTTTVTTEPEKDHIAQPGDDDFIGPVAPSGMASGGKVTKPSWHFLGEGGEPEWVIPQSKLGSFFSKILGTQSQTQKLVMPVGSTGGINNSRSTNYNVNANYTRSQDPQSLRLDLEAIAMMAGS